MDRHTFLLNTFYIFSAGMTIPNLPFNLFRIHDSHKSEFDRLFANLDSSFILTKHADELGSDYLAGRNGKRFEKDWLFNNNPGNSPHSMNRITRLPAFAEVQAMIQSDFDTGNTIRLQGWILSDTEAKLCALYKMTT